MVVEEHAVVARYVNVAIAAGVVEIEVLRGVVLFVAVPVVVDAVGLGMAGGAVAEAVEIVGAVEAEFAH